jgi:hypothetical protein
VNVQRPTPQVYLKKGGNPWGDTLSDATVQGILLTAAIKGEKEIAKWIEAEEAEPDAVFAQVYLDPTNPRTQLTIVDRIFAVVTYGDPAKAFDYLPNAAAKADASDRHGCPNGELVEEANFCLGDGDFAWGDCAYHNGAISAGSGFKVWQDLALAQLTLEDSMNAVHAARAAWLSECRAAGSQGWYNRGNVPGEQYRFPVRLGEWLAPPRS